MENHGRLPLTVGERFDSSTIVWVTVDPRKAGCWPVMSNGRALGFDPGGTGSIPVGPSNFKKGETSEFRSSEDYA